MKCPKLHGFVDVFQTRSRSSYNRDMQTTVPIPLWLRRSHPIVQRYLRQPLARQFQRLLLVLTVAAFLVLFRVHAGHSDSDRHQFR